LVPPVELVKAPEGPEDLKTPVVREVCHTVKEPLAAQVIGELVGPEVLVRCTAVAAVVADITAAAVEAPTRTHAALMPEAVVGDLHTLTPLGSQTWFTLKVLGPELDR
jgi:hypothetical protein